MPNSHHSNLVSLAETFARHVHKGQERYRGAVGFFLVDHLVDVASLVETYCPTETALALAWLHDTVEDTLTTVRDIEKNFGREIAAQVEWLTDPPYFSTFQKQWERKLAQASRIKLAPDIVRQVKVADQFSNVRSLARTWPDRWAGEVAVSYVKGAQVVVDSCATACPAEMVKAFREQCDATLALHGQFQKTPTHGHQLSLVPENS